MLLILAIDQNLTLFQNQLLSSVYLPSAFYITNRKNNLSFAKNNAASAKGLAKNYTQIFRCCKVGKGLAIPATIIYAAPTDAAGGKAGAVRAEAGFPGVLA